MPAQTCTVEQAVALLNAINDADPTVLPALIAYRVPCNVAVAAHPTVQVGRREDGSYEVGLLGILNGLFGVDDKEWGYVFATATQDERGIVKFTVGMPPGAA